MKKHLTRQEEFDILKIVIDKFLLLAILIMFLGVIQIVDTNEFVVGLSVILGGVVLLIILAVVLIREYEFIKS